MDRRRLGAALIGAALIITAVMPATAAAAGPQRATDRLEELRLEEPGTARDGVRPSVLAASLRDADGARDVVIQLKAAPSAKAKGAAAQKQQLKRVEAEQAAFVARAKKIDASMRVLGRTQTALNAVMAKVDGKALAKLSRDPAVVSIRPVVDYQLDLSETVPYIGGTAVQQAGYTGKGVVVAVLDSGIDYTHAAFGGPGTTTAYKVAYGSKTKHQSNQMITEAFNGRKLFPSAKVIGGYDFVGESWPNGPLAPDPDPIDCGGPEVKDGCDGGHGTHVADIIAGKMGVAPDAKLLAVKVCSAVSTSCSGVALIQGMDFAIDPNQDGATGDAVHIINMSLGSPYGPAPDDDLSAAVETATGVGTLVVTSSGNSGDKPYVTGTPGAAPSALSVAQTAVPSAKGFAMELGAPYAGLYEAVFQTWSQPLTTAVSSAVQYGDGAGGNLLGCDPFPANSLTGKVVLVDRGVCNFSLKIANIAAGGAGIGVIGLVAPGDPFEGSLGDCPNGLCAQVPGYMVSQATANRMKTGVVATFDPANGIDLVKHMVGSSSRGPGNLTNLIKPEIGAPGASVSALVGTGVGTEPFGGTSGAAPMVSGSAALLREAFKNRSPLEIKAVLINTGETDILTRPELFGGQIAPITRIGGGEVRVKAALDSPAAAWEDGAKSAALSFGFHDVTGTSVVTKTVRVRNYSSAAITYAINPAFRFANDVSNGAVSVAAPAQVVVPAKGDATFDVTVTIDGSKLRAWSLNSGSAGASGATLQTLEYDGYLWLDNVGTTADDESPLHLPWQTLPRPAAEVTASSAELPVAGSVDLANSGRGGAVEAYSLVATSDDDAASSAPGDNLSDADFKGIGVGTFGIGASTCSYAYAFMASTWERQSHAVAPVLFEFDIDVDRDGTMDYAVYNRDAAGLSALSDGRNLTYVLNIATGVETANFYTDHRTNSANTGLYFCFEQIGLGSGDLGRTVDVQAFAVDFYTSGQVRDYEEFSVVLGGERYLGVVGAAGYGGGDIAAGSSAALTVMDFGATGTNPTESGLLLRVVDGTAATENILVTVVP